MVWYNVGWRLGNERIHFYLDEQMDRMFYSFINFVVCVLANNVRMVGGGSGWDTERE